MNHIIKFKKKLDLLMISIEALDLYTFNNINEKIDQHNILKKIFLIRSGNDIRNTQNSSLFNFNQSIQIIYQIYRYAKQIYLQKIIIQILYNYSYFSHRSIELQYLKRFQYIYMKTQDYYNHFSYYKTIKIDQLAINNLFIIHKINCKDGFYFLIKYLLFI